MIKNIKIRINVDQRGAITCGSLVGGRPKGLDHFDLAPFPELRAVYGDKPKSLVIYLPSDDLMSCFDCEYSAWGKSSGGPVKKRICDGEECLHRVRETIGTETFGAGELSPCVCENMADDDPAHCRYSAHLKAYVADPESRSLVSPVCYVLRTHSNNSGDAVYSELQKVFSLTSMLFGQPRLTGIPFLLSVAMVSRRDDAGRKFPIWRIQALTFETPSSGASMLNSGVVESSPARALTAGSAAATPAGVTPGTIAEPVPPSVGAGRGDLPETVAPPPVSQLLAEVEQLGEGLFGEQWDRKKSDGALKVSGGATPELTALEREQLQELRGILQRSLQERE